MIGPDRRRTPRIKLERYAYINIEPSNGGIVLNVSEGGLCFHSFDPVQRNGKIRFCFWDHKQRIDADGELAWMDETQKAGLRFASLSPEAREQVRNWMSQPGTPAIVGAPVSRPVPPPRAFPPVGVRRAETTTASGEAVTPAVHSPQVRVRVPLKGFSGGLATGLLVSLLVASGFLFHIYRNQVGESLIRLGEQFAAKPQVPSQAVLPAAEIALPAPQVISPAPASVLSAPLVASPPPQSQSPAAALVSASRIEKLQPPPKAAPTVPPPVPLTVVRNAPRVTTTAEAPAILAAPPSVSLPTTSAAPDFSRIPGNAVTVPQLAPAPPDVHAEESRANNADSTSEMFFEVGRFKDKRQAHTATDKLAQLGFPTNTVQKNHLWAGSYHVLVGPYDDDQRATATHKNLVSYGFKPRPFERGSRNLNLRSGVKLNGTAIPVGECTISWESYVSDATVKFVHDNSVVTTADGRWVKRDVKYDVDAYMYRKNGDGSRTLLEIRFAGMRQALDFSLTGSRSSR